MNIFSRTHLATWVAKREWSLGSDLRSGLEPPGGVAARSTALRRPGRAGRRRLRRIFGCVARVGVLRDSGASNRWVIDGVSDHGVVASYDSEPYEQLECIFRRGQGESSLEANAVE